MGESKEIFLLCFYHIRQGGHVNYHHVVIPSRLVTDEEVLKRLEGDGYTYYLMSSVPVLLTLSEQKNDIIKSLIMDGESLWKRLKKKQKTV
jgi:hypothetical protein